MEESTESAPNRPRIPGVPDGPNGGQAAAGGTRPANAGSLSAAGAGQPAGYHPVTAAIIGGLAAICGQANVASDDKSLARYSRDQVPEERYAHRPEVVVKPRTSAEVVEILRLASRERIPVTPRGAGSGLSGGAVPLFGGISLSLERMNRILEIDTKNLIAVVEPGVVTNKLDEALRPFGLFFAGYPMSEEFCFIGGNVAENAGGGRAIKYGVTGRYITGLEVVLANGQLLQLGGKRLKDVTGYDLVSLIVGSEGTLGVITKIFVRLMPRPTHRSTTAALFSDPRSAIALVPAIMTGGKLVPTSVEFIDRESLAESCKMLRETIPYEEAGAMLLLEVDGVHEAQVHADAEVLRSVCRSHAPIALLVAESDAESDRLWKIRKTVPWALKRRTSDQSIEDIVVPIASIPEALDELRRLEERFGVSIPCFGHAGDGNLHAHVQKNPAWSREEWERQEPEILTRLYEAVFRLGGTISGEHGIGHKRKPYLSLVMSPGQIELLRQIKRVFDPAGILNPGKIFD